MNIVEQKKGGNWIDETGMEIPYNRITQSEKLKERVTAKMARTAAGLNKQMTAFKQLIIKECKDVVASVRNEIEALKETKGNYTFYNFARTIRVEVSINEEIKFDDLKIDAAKDILMTMIDNNISGDDFIKQIVMDAFQTRKGSLDTKRVLGLKRHTERIKNAGIKEQWAKAMDLIDQSITRPGSTTYYRISVKNEQGRFENIDLNFSSINVVESSTGG